MELNEKLHQVNIKFQLMSNWLYVCMYVLHKQPESREPFHGNLNSYDHHIDNNLNEIVPN